MIYRNYIDIIQRDLKEIYPFEAWKEREIVIFGFNIIAKGIAGAFRLNDVDNFRFIDHYRAGTVFMGKTVEKPGDVLGADHDFVMIIASDNIALFNEVIACQNGRTDNIYNLSYLKWNYFRNDLELRNFVRPASLRDCQVIMADVLREFHEFCTEHELKYYIDAGTLLGAVRHKGFIPWDDDIDVAMPVKDYFKFCRLYKGSEKSFLDSIFNDELENYQLSTVSKVKSKKCVAEHFTYPIRYYSGMEIDIFPLYGYPSDQREQAAFHAEIEEIEHLWKEKAVLPYGTAAYSKEVHKDVFDKMNELLVRYDYDTSELVGFGWFGELIFSADGTKIMRKEWYGEPVLLEFEGLDIYAPQDWDSVLKKWYSDYMMLPPAEKRKPKTSYTVFTVNGYADYF